MRERGWRPWVFGLKEIGMWEPAGERWEKALGAASVGSILLWGGNTMRRDYLDVLWGWGDVERGLGERHEEEKIRGF